RLILGVGSGHVKAEFAVLGARYERRGRTTDEALGAIAAAWEQEIAAYAGETVAFRDVIVAPRPVQRPRPPIWVGGNSRAALRRAARLADGWIPWQLTPEDLAAAAAAARALRAEARREAPFALVAPLDVPVEAGAEAVLAAAARWRRDGPARRRRRRELCRLVRADRLARPRSAAPSRVTRRTGSAARAAPFDVA